jgi:hypothetical protein
MALVTNPLAANEFQPEGRWVLVLPISFSDELGRADRDFSVPCLLMLENPGTELAIISVEKTNGGYQAKLVDAFQPAFAEPESVTIKSLACEQREVSMVLDSSSCGELRFRGAPLERGEEAGQVLGTLRARGQWLPARLERTDADKVAGCAAPNPKYEKVSQAHRTLVEAAGNPDPKERVAKIEELLKELHGPVAQKAYRALLDSAEQGGLSAERLGGHLQRWFAGAEPYGAIWLTETRLTALAALRGRKSYTELALDVARQVRRELDDEATLEHRCAVIEALASAARLAGNDDIATAAEAELSELNARLDVEYHAKVPPFKPEPYAGRENAAHDRVVLLELFTGGT